MNEFEQQRFAPVYEDNVARVYGFFGYRVRARHWAEDLTQQTFERALRSWHLFDETKASPGTWLMAIARNILIDSYRRDRSDREEPLGEEAEVTLSAGDEERGWGISPELASALERLGQQQREVIALRFGGDLTGPEIADLTGLTLANVQQILSRSLRKLRDELTGKEAAEQRT